MAEYAVSYRYDRTLLQNEIIQRSEEGADPTLLEELQRVVDAENDLQLSPQEFADLYARISAVPTARDWPYEEPSDLEGIRAARPEGPAPRLAADTDLDDRVHGAWLGRACGCLLGKPVEGWTRERIADYLKRVDAYPLSFYFPPAPIGTEAPDWHPSASESLQGQIDGMPRDDDMDYPILNLTIAERTQLSFHPGDIATAWLEHFPYEGIYTAERLAYRNLVDEHEPPESAWRFNPYREWIGAQIRADLWGYVSPGDPERAASLAWRDASVSHTKNGIYGEMFVAALIAAALATRDLDEAIDAALAQIPARSRFAEMVQTVRSWVRDLPDWEVCLDRVQEGYGRYHWVHTLNNAAVVIMALAYSGADYERGITLAVMGGWDTDCNGATVGSVLGALHGAGSIPSRWTEPLHDEVRSFVLGQSLNRISDLAARTRAVTRLASAPL